MITQETVIPFENGCKIRLEPINPDLSVYLFLPEEDSWRFLGNFTPSDGILFMKRWSRHRHRALNAFGLSEYAIKALEPEGLKLFVLYMEDTRESFEISLETAKDVGSWKWWKEGGFDRQLFVPIPQWTKKR